jgi:hypothetical protein
VDDLSPIGVAVTSGSHPNRRSRSLGELRGAMSPKPVERRRSDEIRYWRESYDPGVLSPMSSNKADEAEEPIAMNEPEIPRDVQPQPFNFGPMGEMAGMKITQAASLETRVHKLEKRVHEMERVVIFTRKQHTSREPLVFQDPPKRRSRSRPQTENSEPSLPGQESYRGIQHTSNGHARASQIRSSSYGSSRPSTTSTHASYHPTFDNTTYPFLSSTDNGDYSSSQTTARPLSTSTTIRNIPSSSPTLPKDGGLTGEHYVALTNMILAEQAARQHLETVVRTLQLQVQKLRAKDAMSNHFEQITPRDGDFSTFEQGNSDDEGEYTREDFKTPSEERTFADGVFGVNSPEIKTPRTLSLSQMTLKKSVHPSLNF